MTEVNDDQIIETVTEDGEVVQFRLFDIIEYEEKEYALGAEFLSQKLSVEQQTILANMESNYAEKYSIASTYPFYCGLICAFEQFFLPDQKQAFDFNTSINEDLNTLPRMKRHVRYHELNTRILDDTNQLLADADEETAEHITSITCGWDQRIHSASVYAFYIGYRFGLNLMLPMDQSRGFSVRRP